MLLVYFRCMKVWMDENIPKNCFLMEMKANMNLLIVERKKASLAWLIVMGYRYVSVHWS